MNVCKSSKVIILFLLCNSCSFNNHRLMLLDNTKLVGLPAIVNASEYAVIDTYFTESGLTVYELHYHTSKGKKKRTFVGITKNPKKGLVIAFSGSDSKGDGASDVILGTGTGYQQNWGAKFSLYSSYPIIAPDPPIFGSFPYEHITDASETLIDDICGVATGIKFLKENNVQISSSWLTGGVSWGGNRAMMFAATIGNVRKAYISGASITKRWSTRFLPVDKWDDIGWDIPNIISSSKHVEWKFTYGHKDYMIENNPVPRASDILGEIGLNYYEVGIGHTLVYEDLKSFLSE